MIVIIIRTLCQVGKILTPGGRGPHMVTKVHIKGPRGAPIYGHEGPYTEISYE